MYVKDENGNIRTITIIAGSLPEGFEEVEVPEELQSEELRFLEAVEVPAVEYVAPVEAVEAQEAQPEKWIKEGEEDSLVDPEDETWTYVPAVEAVEAVDAVEEVLAVPAYYKVQKRSTADRDRRNDVLNALRAARKPLLDQADIEINKIMDAGLDASVMRIYRQALRDVTSTYIKVDGDPKVAVDTIDLENFNWPQKPE